MAEFADDPNRYLPRAVHAATPRGSVTTGGWWTWHFDDWREFEVGVTVCIVEGTRLARADLFAEDAADAALSLFQSLTEP